MRSRRFSVRMMMGMVLAIALTMSAARCVRNLGTVFAPGVQRDLFDERLISMTKDEVLAVHGPPLFADRGDREEELWIYSKQVRPTTMYYWRLELIIDGKTRRVNWYFHKFYVD